MFPILFLFQIYMSNEADSEHKFGEKVIKQGFYLHSELNNRCDGPVVEHLPYNR